ncbi:MAG: sigma-70 family RNA polymerase sigma factor [Planctomycetota bacterium]
MNDSGRSEDPADDAIELTDDAIEHIHEPGDAEQVAAIKNRDGQALAQYITQHRDRLLGFVRNLCSDRLLAVIEPDDLLQEVSTAALSGLSTAPLDRYSPMQWLHQICRRRIVDAHRYHFEAKRRDAGRRQTIHGGGSDDSGGMEALLVASMTSPSAAFSRDVRMSRMAQAIAALPEDQRDVVQMRYAQGMSSKDIAQELGKSDVSVRVMLSRCMRQLEKELKDVRPER